MITELYNLDSNIYNKDKITLISGEFYTYKTMLSLHLYKELIKAMEKEQSIHKLFVGFQEWHKNEYGSKYVEIDQFNEYLETFKSE